MDALTPAIGFTRTNGSQVNINSQRRSIEAWAARTGHTITAWTGSLDDALDLVKTGSAKTVVATDLDRFGRNATVVLGWLDKLKAADGRAETLDGPVDPGSMETVLRLAAELDEFEQAQKSARTATYHRTLRQPGPDKNVQQQAAKAWNAAEVAGREVVEVDGARLDDGPPRP